MLASTALLVHCVVVTTIFFLIVACFPVSRAAPHGILPHAPETQPTPGARILAADLQVYDCPDEETVEIFDNTTALSLGLGVATMLTGEKRAGGHEGTWYEDKLRTLLVEYCEENRRGVHHRCVYLPYTEAQSKVIFRRRWRVAQRLIGLGHSRWFVW